MYGFNYILFRRLSEVLKVSNSSIADKLSLDRSTFYDRLGDGNIKLLHLIKICNHYHIPIRHFVEGDFIPSEHVTRFYYTQPHWKKITWQKEGVGACLKNAKSRKLTQKEIAASIGVTVPTLLNWAAEESTITVPNALALCNLTGTDLMEMVTDHNSWKAAQEAMSTKAPDTETDASRKKTKVSTEQKIEMLWDRLERLEGYVEEIQESLHLLSALSAAKPKYAYGEPSHKAPFMLNEENSPFFMKNKVKETADTVGESGDSRQD